MELRKKGLIEFEKQYGDMKLSEKEKTLVILSYMLGYADSKIDTYKRRVPQ